MKRTGILTALAVFLISGYIGFSTNYTNTAKAKEVVVLQPMQMPQPGFKLNLDLNKGTASVSNTEKDVKINIKRKDSIIYKTRYKKVFVDKEVPVRVLPSFAKVHNSPVVLASMANSR